MSYPAACWGMSKAAGLLVGNISGGIVWQGKEKVNNKYYAK